MHYTLPVIVCIGLSVVHALGQGDVEKLPPGINTELYDETTPVLSIHGDRLFFTRTGDPDFEASLLGEDGLITSNKTDEAYWGRLAEIYSQIAGRDIPDPSSSVFNQDIWYAVIQEDSIMEVVHPGYPLNNALPNSLVSTGMLKDEYILLNQFFQDGSMYSGFSRVVIDQNRNYSFPKPMHIYEFYVTGSDVNMTMTPNGHVLVLSMERSDSKGHNDLYVSFYVKDNLWSAPLHMGDQLNSPYQETTPYISPDKRYLYFSSDRPGGVGGNDIYVSERLDYSWLRWSRPMLMEGEVNSAFDDSQPYFNPQATYMYFSSKRDGTSDIFRKRLTPYPRLKTPIYVKGKIIDASTGKPTRAELFWGQQSSQDYMEYFNSYNGDFVVVLTEYEPYKFQPRKPNHTAQRILMDPRLIEKQGKDTVEMILYVEPRETKEKFVEETVPFMVVSEEEGYPPEAFKVNETITFYDIHFVKSKATILGSSFKALQFLLDRMLIQPTIEILIEGHTDNVGVESALIDLSLARAEAIRDYLVHHGVARERIRVTGLGATKPVASNVYESGREKNRRVEIRILKL